MRDARQKGVRFEEFVGTGKPVAPGGEAGIAGQRLAVEGALAEYYRAQLAAQRAERHAAALLAQFSTALVHEERRRTGRNKTPLSSMHGRTLAEDVASCATVEAFVALVAGRLQLS